MLAIANFRDAPCKSLIKAVNAKHAVMSVSSSRKQQSKTQSITIDGITRLGRYNAASEA